MTPAPPSRAEQSAALRKELMQELMGKANPEKSYKPKFAIQKKCSTRAKFNANPHKKAKKGDVPNYMPVIKRDRE